MAKRSPEDGIYALFIISTYLKRHGEVERGYTANERVNPRWAVEREVHGEAEPRRRHIRALHNFDVPRQAQKGWKGISLMSGDARTCAELRPSCRRPRAPVRAAQRKTGKVKVAGALKLA